MQLKIHVITIEDLMPARHLLRKLDAVLDFSFVYEWQSIVEKQEKRYGRN